MNIEAIKLIDLPVASMDTLSKIGEVRQVVIDPQGGQVLGFLVQPAGFLQSIKALSIIDVSEWDPNGLVTENEENLVEPREIVRINDITSKKIFLLGMAAKTESGKNLGEIENLLIDTTMQIVVKYYIRDLFGKARIFPADKVVKIEKNTVIFSDDVADISGGVVDVQTV